MTARRLGFVLGLLALLLPGAVAAEPPVPALTGRVVDNAKLLDDWTRGQMDNELAGFETASGIQLVVVTLPDLQGYPIEDWGIALGRGWGIGQKGKNNGLFLVVAPKEHRVRIEVGYGLEGQMPDASANAIIQGIIVPRFRSGDVPGGIKAGVDAIIVGLGGKLPDGTAAPQPLASSSNGKLPDALRVFLPFLIFIVVIIFLNRRRGRVGPWGGVYPYLGGYYGGRSLSGGGGFSGGGFSGGGGSFGGGGASGGW
jgi:uncharacterized protein